MSRVSSQQEESLGCDSSQGEKETGRNSNQREKEHGSQLESARGHVISCVVGYYLTTAVYSDRMQLNPRASSS
ncbi:hypothetical protein SDJN03_21725, partial [Cucurbita argyrosperma subsp. sororia]